VPQFDDVTKISFRLWASAERGIHDTDKVEGGLIVLFFSFVFSVAPLPLEILLLTPLLQITKMQKIQSYPILSQKQFLYELEYDKIRLLG